MTDGVAGSVPQIIGGRFEIVRPLAEGGEAKVYLARDRELDLDVVLKERRILDGDALSSLRREASILMRVVAHPGLPVVRSDLVDGDRYYLISDFIAGSDLQTSVAAQLAGHLEFETVLDIVDQVAQTLDHLHQHRPAIIHGDIKPENLIMTDTRRVVLVDFGAAIRADDDGERLGTPGFSAPEVLAGESISPAADVYSLSALAVYLLTGVVPTLGSSWPTDLANGQLARLEGVLRSGLTWDPLGRPWSATDLSRRLRAASTVDMPTGTVTLMLTQTPALQPGLLALTEGTLVRDVPLPAGISAVVYPSPHDASDDVKLLMTASDGAVALHAGDIGGWHGATLAHLIDESLPLLASAGGGTVVCSPPVRMLLGADASFTFDPHPHGFILRDAARTTGSSPSSRSLSLRSQRAQSWVTSRRPGPIVGREDELARAESVIRTGRAAGLVPLVITMGESGVGKTRLLAELAQAQVDGGDHVFVGRCSQSGGAYELVLDALGDDLFPFDVGQVERDEDGWMDRRHFFGRIAAGLRDLGGPITMVLDDLQWADGSSLALLSQLSDELGGTLVMLAGCRPDLEQSFRDELILQMRGTVIDVKPLAVGGIATMAHAADLVLDPSTIQDLHVLTGGNPFFATQLLDHLRSVPGNSFVGDSLPAGVRDWILRRVDRLGAEVQASLAPAAVIGDTFDVVTLASLLGVSPLEVLTNLDAATTAGLLADGDHPGQFHFAHALVSTTLAGSLSPARRALLHAAVAQILEQGDDLAQLDAALHHWFEADRLGDPLRAAELAVEVATRATERLGHEQAMKVLDRALALLPQAASGTDRDRAEARVRVALGRASLFTSNTDEALRQLYQGADLADLADDPQTLAEAALVASLNRRHGLDDPELLALLERGADRCPSEPAVLPAMLNIRRARLLPWATPHEERCVMAQLGLRNLSSMDLVDRATVESEVARACWGPDDATERDALSTRHIADATRQLSAGGSSRWTGVLIEALNHRYSARVQLGRPIDALSDADRAAQLAEAAGSTFLLSRVMMGQALIHVVLGNHEQAEQLSQNAVAISDRHNLLLDQMALGYSIGRDRGQQRELAKLERQMDEMVGENPLLIGAFALIHAESGNVDDARRLLRRLESQAPWPRNWLWLATTITALEAAVLADEPVMVRRYFAVLKRYSGQWAIAGAELACWGPIDRVLGLAQHSLGHADDARLFLNAARAASVRQGATPWVARCDLGLAAL